MKWIDIPPVWLAGALALTWAQKTWLPMGLGFGPVWADLLGGLLVGGGLVLMALAAYEMQSKHTTLIPHKIPDALVTTGIFSRTRNPIYLADSMILAGMILYWDAVLALTLVPIFIWLMEKRFIVPEEAILRRKFLAQFARYAQQVRRWL